MTSGTSESPRRPGLSAYLNDHLAGGAAALQLVQRCRDREGGSELGRMLESLAREIADDRASLERVMEQVGAPRNPAKRIGAVGAELLLRFKQTLPAIGIGSAAIARLEDLELLSLGIEGKALLWQVLGALADTDDRLASFDFAALEARAREQRATIEPFRREAASLAFAD